MIMFGLSAISTEVLFLFSAQSKTFWVHFSFRGYGYQYLTSKVILSIRVILCLGQPKRHLLTTGWSLFVSGKRLFAGDSVLFIRYNEKTEIIGIFIMFSDFFDNVYLDF